MTHHASAPVPPSARIPDPTSASIQQIINGRLDRTPDDVVLVADQLAVTGAELRRRADHVTGLLAARDVAKGGIVGVGVNDPVDRVAAVLGVWRAGAAFIPVDVTQPDARLRALLASVEPDVVVVDQTTAPAAWLANRPTVVVTGETDGSSAAPTVTVGPDDLAYLMPTSGSTGTPNIVAVCHRSVVNYLAAAFETYLDLSPDSVVLQLAPFTFDPWLRDVVGSLVAGATLVLLPRDERRDPSRVLDAIRCHGVTDLLAVVPSMVTALVRSPSFDTEPIRLRSTLVSGESAQQLRRHGDRLRPFGRLINQYGTTESTLVATWHERTDRDPPGVDIVGRPLPGVSVAVLDQDLRVVPIGTPGEISIGGASLALGYWRDPTATERAFVPDPFGPPGARRYRTGDLGRWLPDGRLVHLGRMDQQVKIRGHRVDPREVERLVLGDPDLADAAVVGRLNGDADTVLVAYVVPRPGATLDPTAIRARLAGLLSEYAVPNYVMPLTALPHNSNGKLDVAALPDPSPHVPPRTATNAPATALERGLAKIWSDVLGVVDPPTDANFFALGGHSLLAAQVVGRVRAALGLDLTVAQVLGCPTIAAVAAAISAPSVREPSLERRTDRRRVPLSLQQQRAVFQQRRYGLDTDALGGDAYIVALAYRLTGAVDRVALTHAVDDIVERHEALRTRFELSGKQSAALLRPRMSVPVEMVDLTAVTEPDRAAAADEHVRLATTEPFRLDVGPPLRVRLIQLTPTESVLVIAMHHIVSDGWSFGVFLRELGERYGGHVAGAPPTPVPLAVQYGDYALWQHERVLAGRIAWQRAHSRDRLRGLTPLNLPTDRARVGIPDWRSERVDLALSGQLSRALHALGHRHDATLHMVLTAGLAVLLTGLCGSTDVGIGTPIANRAPHETEPLIGLFTNTVILRADLATAHTFAEVLAVVRSAAIEAYRCPDVAVENVVDSADPPVRVLFVLQNAPLAPLRLFGVTTEPLAVSRHETKYELVFSLTEVAGGMSGYLEYQTALFDAGTAERYATAWRDLLVDIVRDPTAPVATLRQHADRARPARLRNDAQ